MSTPNSSPSIESSAVPQTFLIQSESLRDQAIAFGSGAPALGVSSENVDLNIVRATRTSVDIERAWLSGVLSQHDEVISAAAMERLEARWAQNPIVAQIAISMALASFVEDQPISQALFNQGAAIVAKMNDGRQTEVAVGFSCPISRAVRCGRGELACAAMEAGISPVSFRSIAEALDLGDTPHWPVFQTPENHRFAKLATVFLLSMAENNIPAPCFKHGVHEHLEGIGNWIGTWAAGRLAADPQSRDFVEFLAPFTPFMTEEFWATKNGQAIAKAAPHLVVHGAMEAQNAKDEGAASPKQPRRGGLGR